MLNDILAYYLFRIANVKAFIIYDIFNIAELAFFFLYLTQIIKNKKIIKYLPLVFFLYLAACIIDYIFIRKDKFFNSTMTGLEEILIITLCLYYFYEQLKETNTLLIYATKNFWIIIAFLIFSSGTFFLYVYAENMVHDQKFKDQYAVINSSFTILKNILFTIAMLIKPETNSKSYFVNNELSADWTKI